MRKEKLITGSNILLGLATMLLLISVAVVATLNFRPMYYADIRILDIPEQSGLGEKEIRENYDALIDYNSIFYTGELQFPSLAMSETGKIHFEEVKEIFVALQGLMIALLVVVAVGFILKLRKKKIAFLKLSAIFSVVIPLVCAALVAISWESFFVLFHSLFFRNDYWIFDPATDPVITILPDGFFLHCAVMIVVLVLVGSGVLYLVYRLLKKRGWGQHPEETEALG